MIDYFDSEGLEVRLAAPTGRAAKRMQEATGCEAQTIHRMLRFPGQQMRKKDQNSLNETKRIRWRQM